MAREISYENLHFCCFPSRPPWPWPKDFYLRILGGFPVIQLHSYQIHIEKGFGSLAQVALRTSWPCQIIPQTYYCTEIQRRGALPPYFSPRRTPSKPCGQVSQHQPFAGPKDARGDQNRNAPWCWNMHTNMWLVIFGVKCWWIFNTCSIFETFWNHHPAISNTNVICNTKFRLKIFAHVVIVPPVNPHDHILCVFFGAASTLDMPVDWDNTSC